MQRHERKSERETERERERDREVIQGETPPLFIFYFSLSPLPSGRDIRLLSASVLSSARRWSKRGVWTVTAQNWLFVSAFLLLRISPHTLYRYYYGFKVPLST